MSDSQHICNKLLIKQSFEKNVLGGSCKANFTIANGVSASISQTIDKRVVEISAVPYLTCDEMFVTFQNIEKLLMLFDGKFYPLETMAFSMDETEFPDISRKYKQKRLDYFSTKIFYQYPWLKLMSFHDVITDVLYKKWCCLLELLDIVFQMFLYSLSDNKMTVDLNFAFLVELAEPFVELLKEKTYYCQALTPGERGTTLKMCVDNLIMSFGKSIFFSELSNDYAEFLDNVVGSRVRIMHIKKKQTKYFDGSTCIKYSMKFSLLYRKILFELLNIPNDKYDVAIKNAAEIINKWK